MAVILIVEDELFIRDVAEYMLEDFGHSTIPANSVDEALSILNSNRHIDALFTDIRLDAVLFGGFEVARQAVELRPDLPVLYTTGNTITDEMSALFVDGALFLQKPYTQDQLQHSIENLLNPAC